MLEATYRVKIRNTGDVQAMSAEDVVLAIRNEAAATLADDYLASLVIDVTTEKADAVGAAITHAIMARLKHAEENGEPAEFIDGLAIAADIAADVGTDITTG